MMADLPDGVNNDLLARHIFDDEPAARTLLMAIRQALIIAIGAIEDYLDIQRSIVPRRKR